MEFIFDNNVPIYIQLVEQVKIAILSGNYAPGDRLPSVRELALQGKVNPNTMQRALLELEEMGLIYTERTNGKFVTRDQGLIDALRHEYAQSLCRLYLRKMREVGFTASDAKTYIREESVK